MPFPHWSYWQDSQPLWACEMSLLLEIVYLFGRRLLLAMPTGLLLCMLFVEGHLWAPEALLLLCYRGSSGGGDSVSLLPGGYVTCRSGAPDSLLQVCFWHISPSPYSGSVEWFSVDWQKLSIGKKLWVFSGMGLCFLWLLLIFFSYFKCSFEPFLLLLTVFFQKFLFFKSFNSRHPAFLSP